LEYHSDNDWNPNMGGLVVENVWEGEIIIGGDLRVTGCNAGSSVGASGGQSAVVSIVSGLCAIPLRTAVACARAHHHCRFSGGGDVHTHTHTYSERRRDARRLRVGRD
jgi:hypothetical protein